MYTFRKNERLANYRLQSMLFENGQSFHHHPLRVQWMLFPEEKLTELFPGTKEHSGNAAFMYPAKLLVSVSKKKIKRATDRNRLKRLVKEAYRKNKNGFYSFLLERQELGLVAMMYTADNVMTYKDIEKAVSEVLKKLIDKGGKA